MTEFVKIVFTVPESHASVVREAAGKAGAGRVGNYAFCSFSVKGTGRFLPLEGAHPAIGEVGIPEEVAEERIEITATRASFKDVILAIKAVHPYEEPMIDVYPLETI